MRPASLSPARALARDAASLTLSGLMRSAVSPDNELERIETLKDLAILDSVPEQSFDDLALLAATICDAPASLVSLDDGQRQWFKSSHGIGLEQTGREVSFCAHAILQPGEIMEVPDATQDERFADNPLVTGEQQVRFYAGAPLVTEEGHVLGTLCVLDRRPRHLKPHQRAALQALARQTVAQLTLRSVRRALQKALEDTRTYQAALEDYQGRLRQLNIQLQTLAITDPLTGVYNRLALAQQLSQALAHAARAQEPVSLLLIDADYFKAFNDTFGHQAGDDALCALAQVIRAAVRAADIVARYGGEEFVVILPATDGAGASALAERVRTAVQAARWCHRNLTVSIGVVTRPPGHPRCTTELLIADADAALYRAKAAGRNQVVSAEQSRNRA